MNTSNYIKQKARKNLNGLLGYHTDMQADLCLTQNPDEESIYGVYINEPNISAQRIAVGSRGLYVYSKNEENSIDFISYLNIEIIRTPRKEDRGKDLQITLRTKGSVEKTIHVTGGEGKTLDVFGFLHFLMRVTKWVQDHGYVSNHNL